MVRSWNESSRWLGLALVAGLLLGAASALATVPASPPEQLPADQYRLWLEGGPRGDRLPPTYLGPFNYLREFVQMTDFLAAWQMLDPDSPDYGGMIEAESGDLGGVIQTDNTLEAIWCWSRYRELTGRTDYDENIAAAWVYCQTYPAWEEEGNPGDDYYRDHNCAWGLAAALQYEAATGDDGFARYATSCAQYIADHPLDLTDGDAWAQRLDAFVKGWCAGSLYRYAEAVGNPAYLAAALAQGQDVLGWLDTSPRFYLGYEYWAMSSGTSAWGVCNSVFRDDPAAGQAWLAANVANMDVWQDWYDVPGYDWNSAWNVAYANGHFAAWDVTGDPASWDNGRYVTDLLLSLDTDDDGGITAESVDLPDEDMSWVTCYLIKFGVDRLLGEPFDHDTGVLRFLDLEEGQEFAAGEPVPLRVIATNYGLADETEVTVRLTGGGEQFTVTTDLAFARLDTLELAAAWIPSQGGDIELTATTLLAGDEDPGNDAVSLTIHVDTSTGVGHDRTPVAALTLEAGRPNPFNPATTLRFDLPQAAAVELAVYDVAGRRVATLLRGALPAGRHEATWQGRDDAGGAVPSGVYLARLRCGGESRTSKLVLAK